ncbi:hypothetical protein ACQPYK_02980 [Streptosporangium sp. CA-135522]|uniref:hypothetical protein n=1 Tax=Streptosporangium sp. CA-135522 TaxID=3240072 RepID=UPI003D8C5124
MSNASRNIRGILAVAALTAGVSWVVTAPASAGGMSCHGQDVVEVLQTPGSVAAVCEETGGVRGGTAVGRMTAPGGEAAATVDRLARIAGLPGLSRASAVVSFADTAGVAAGAGLPALPSGMPGFSGHSPAGTLASAPDLPGLPGTPGAELTRLPVSTVPSVPAFTDSAGALSDGAALPLRLPHPASVKAVTEDLPAAIEPKVPALPETGPADIAPSKVTSKVTSEVAEGTSELPALDGVLPALGIE